MPRLLPRSVLLLSAGLVAISAAALDWPVTHIAVKAVPLQKSAESYFEFTNSSDHAVTITRIDTSCDCLEVTPSAKTIAPGSSGRLTARFNIRDRVGTYQRTIIVTTDDGQETTLTAELDIPEVARLLPRSLNWELHGTPGEKTIEIQIVPGVVLAINNVHCTNAAFTHRLETVEAGRHYRLHVTPRDINTATNAAFRLYAKAATGQDLVLSVYGNVR